jgi:hypothetical protein
VKVLTTSVLAFEAIVVALGIPVAARLGPLAGRPAAAWGGLLLVALCLLAIVLVRRRGALWAGTAVQVLLLATAVVVPAMAVLGAIFCLLWWAAVHYGRKADALDARYPVAVPPQPPPKERS